RRASAGPASGVEVTEFRIARRAVDRAPNLALMEKSAIYNPPLLSEDLSQESGEILQLDKSALVDALRGVNAAESIAAVREGIAALKRNLGEADSPLRSTSSDAGDVEFASSHLNQELDQIAASQTLERAVYYLERLIKSVTEVRSSGINDINLNRWKECSDI